MQTSAGILHRTYAYCLLSRGLFKQHILETRKRGRGSVRFIDGIQLDNNAVHPAVDNADHHGPSGRIRRHIPSCREFAETESFHDASSYCCGNLPQALGGRGFVDVIISQFGTLGLATGGLILGSISAAAAICLILRLQKTEKRTIVIEVGMQNAAQAIAVATSPFVFGNPVIATPAIIYALLMNIVLLTYVAVIGRR